MKIIPDPELEAESKRQEDSLRRFRMKECNLLISSSHLEVGVDNVRCNLVVAFDFPKTFKHYANYKVKAKASKSHFLLFSENEDCVKSSLDQFAATESLLRSACAFPGSQDFNAKSTVKIDENHQHEYNPFYSINRYCSRLPSDTFTRLTPLFGFSDEQCRILLPINSPIRHAVTGSGPSLAEAQFQAATALCEQLRQIKELDENMLPYGREISKHR